MVTYNQIVSARSTASVLHMLITKRVEFSASHVCRNPLLSDRENEELFGAAANPHGHGHNYVIEVTVEGDPDPVTGMVLDLKKLKDVVNREVIETVRSPVSELRSSAFRPRRADRGEYRHRHLESPGAARLAQEGGRTARRPGVRDGRPVRRLFWGSGVIRVTRAYRFSASHRLHAARTCRTAKIANCTASATILTATVTTT